MNETNLRELCIRVALGDDDARRDFDRDVLPHIEFIVARWLSRQGPSSPTSDSRATATSAETLVRLTGAVCARMVAKAANENRPRLRKAMRPAHALPIGETLLIRAERATIFEPVSGPA